MRLRIAIAFFAACLVATVLLPAAAGAQESTVGMSVSELVAQDTEADGMAVVVTGEAIGEALRADDGHVWVNVLGDGTAIGVWMAEEDAAAIGHFGQYDTTGDDVEVHGTLNIACDQHGGDLDIHAATVRVLGGGAEREHPPAYWKGILGGIAILVAGVLAVRYRRYSVEVEA